MKLIMKIFLKLLRSLQALHFGPQARGGGDLRASTCLSLCHGV